MAYRVTLSEAKESQLSHEIQTMISSWTQRSDGKNSSSQREATAAIRAKTVKRRMSAEIKKINNICIEFAETGKTGGIELKGAIVHST